MSEISVASIAAPLLLPALSTLTTPPKRPRRGPSQPTRARKFIERTMRSGRLQWTWTELAAASGSDPRHISANVLRHPAFVDFMAKRGLTRWGTERRAFGLILTQQKPTADAD